MKTTIMTASGAKTVVCALASVLSLTACQTAGNNEMTFEQLNDSVTLVHIARPARYLLLPIEESAAESTVRLDTGDGATVCFSNTGDRVIAVPWMSNWQYANIVPTRQFRSANALPRELGLYEQDGELYLSAAPVTETEALRKEKKDLGAFGVDGEHAVESLLEDNEGAFELDMQFRAGTARVMGFKLCNDKGEEVDIYFDLDKGRVVADRTRSGIVDFGEKSSVHDLETTDIRLRESVNYVNDFALGTWGPVAQADTHELRVFVDKCPVELFLDGGKMAMTNLVFPNEPYNQLKFYARGGSYDVDSCVVYRLGML